jgi:hypothetical protein
MEQTALNKHIERLKSLRELYEEKTPQHNILSIAINEAKDELKLEKQQIINSFKDGQMSLIEIIVKWINNRRWFFQKKVEIPKEDFEDAEYYFMKTFSVF